MTKDITIHETLLLFKQQKVAQAKQALRQIVEQNFALDVKDITFRQDPLSLNSANGFIATRDGSDYFFKFHSEEGDQSTGEYYKAKLLQEAGYPVDVPVHASGTPGRQLLLYDKRNSPRVFDAYDSVEDGRSELDPAALLKAQEDHDADCAQKVLNSLHPLPPERLRASAILQLFYRRLVSPSADGREVMGGRVDRFYRTGSFDFPNGVRVPWQTLVGLKWRINGRLYDISLQQAFDRALHVMRPDYRLSYTACTAHGDAHNGNIWLVPAGQGAYQFVLFDPAFAGDDIPALLSDVKSLFHNVFAHPYWLYTPEKMGFSGDVTQREGEIIVEHDWALSDIRKGILSSKIRHFWQPLISHLHSEQLLFDQWEDYVRAALFCCPTLVMNMRSDRDSDETRHTPLSSVIGLSVAIMLAQQPVQGSDEISDFFDSIRI